MIYDFPMADCKVTINYVAVMLLYLRMANLLIFLLIIQVWQFSGAAQLKYTYDFLIAVKLSMLS